MVTTTKELPTMQAIHIKTAIVTSMPTCNGVRPEDRTPILGYC